MSNFEDVGEFHEKFDLPFVREVMLESPRPSWDHELLEFRTKFMQEELDEFTEAVEDHDHAKAFDALLDLVYVAMGTAHIQGYPWQAGWSEVQRANMKKVRAAADGSDSKRGSKWDVVKPPGWEPPDITSVLLRFWFVKVKDASATDVG